VLSSFTGSMSTPIIIATEVNSTFSAVAVAIAAVEAAAGVAALVEGAKEEKMMVKNESIISRSVVRGLVREWWVVNVVSRECVNEDGRAGGRERS